MPTQSIDEIAEYVYAKYTWSNPTTLNKVIADVHKRITSKEFLKNPHKYMTKWKKERGFTEELRLPEDWSHEVIKDLFKC